MRLDRNSLSNRFYMNRFLLFATLIGLIGCDSSTPKPGAAPISPSQELIDNDRIKVVPGPSDPDAPQEFTTTESGLKYRILRRSEGGFAADWRRGHDRTRSSTGTGLREGWVPPHNSAKCNAPLPGRITEREVT